VKHIHVERHKVRRDRFESELLALDPRDPEIVRTKAVRREPAQRRSVRGTMRLMTGSSSRSAAQGSHP
jgi:hypothetical protein